MWRRWNARAPCREKYREQRTLACRDSKLWTTEADEMDVPVSGSIPAVTKAPDVTSSASRPNSSRCARMAAASGGRNRRYLWRAAPCQSRRECSRRDSQADPRKLTRRARNRGAGTRNVAAGMMIRLPRIDPPSVPRLRVADTRRCTVSRTFETSRYRDVIRRRLVRSGGARARC